MAVNSWLRKQLGRMGWTVDADGSNTVRATYYSKGVTVLASSAVAVSCPADTNEDVLATITVPGNSMGLNGSLRIWTLWTMTNSANNKTIRVRFSGANGAQYMVVTNTTTATYHAVTLLGNRGAANSQVGQMSNGLIASSSGAVVTSAVDTTVDTTIVITGQKASAGETITLERYLVELIIP
jgi:hypothetical protein